MILPFSYFGTEKISLFTITLIILTKIHSYLFLNLYFIQYMDIPVLRFATEYIAKKRYFF